jgi:mRNA interferase MazF
MKYNQGDIILLPYPYTDLSNTNQRPAVIISKDAVNKQNYIVAKITSVILWDKFSFPVNPADLDRELKYPSEVRTNEVFTVSPTIIIKKFASLKKEALKRLTESIKDNISVEWWTVVDLLLEKRSEYWSTSLFRAKIKY